MNQTFQRPKTAAQEVAESAPDGKPAHKGGMFKKDGTPRRYATRRRMDPARARKGNANQLDHARISFRGGGQGGKGQRIEPC